MRLVPAGPLFLPLLFASLVVAHPYPRDHLQKGRGASSGIAGRADAATAGGFDFYTTTWTETRTYTSTISSFVGVTTPASGGANGEPCVPPEGSGQIACGPICCANWQYCAYEGQCMANAGGPGSWTEWTTVGVITTQYSAPYRVTSGSTILQTSTPTTTGTAASETASPSDTAAPVPVESTNGQLSGGAIAGIVIGTIAGVILLLLLCFCCIARGLWGVLAGILGLGKKKKSTERIEVIEEHYSRRGSRHGSAYGAARPAHRTWFGGGGGGGGGGRPSSAGERKEKSSGAGLGMLAAGLGALGLLLGLRKDDRRRPSSHKPSRSEWSSGYYTDSYTASSPSEFILERGKLREGVY
ncbi:hypothetical protein GGS23DRAFT_405928 [Durotheca rogersii]|uniref:uncharacterized protein n=1 Tax=Durotheca rogersii TaxID=419775 RepID=UPI00221EAAE9|nr:uncharacterized protein GGS23DRAFT_405928 [Durotheca rogersii]KAI5865040.1 hypothetical protein GGS23DRAFT_405928 [Durotheca rogersii]